jgi:hypothetical protein
MPIQNMETNSWGGGLVARIEMGGWESEEKKGVRVGVDYTSFGFLKNEVMGLAKKSQNRKIWVQI